MFITFLILPSIMYFLIFGYFQLCTADLFGILSEEKEIAKIAIKTSEARHKKTYDTLQILAQYITESCFLDLILPIKNLLETSHSFKTVHKAEEALRFIALGLVDNTFVTIESLLKFAYGVASESIPQLLPKAKKVLTEKDIEKMQREKEDCFIISKLPNNRLAFRQQNVKTSLKTNAHLLVEFGIRFCYIMLKRDKLKDENYHGFLDPFVNIFKKCLKSKHIKVILFYINFIKLKNLCNSNLTKLFLFLSSLSSYTAGFSHFLKLLCSIIFWFTY